MYAWDDPLTAKELIWNLRKRPEKTYRAGTKVCVCVGGCVGVCVYVCVCVCVWVCVCVCVWVGVGVWVWVCVAHAFVITYTCAVVCISCA